MYPQSSRSHSQQTAPLLNNIDSVPKTMENRAKLLIQKLKDHFDVISWNDNGQLVSEGAIVPNSNIVDLVNDVMTNEKEKRFQSRTFKHICQSTREDKCTRGLSKEPQSN